MTTHAILSPCRTYRYRLERRWGPGDAVAFIMLNPSTADETADDPTIRRCVGFAKAWGYDALLVCNLFALRATDPKVLYSHPDPVGPENDKHLAALALDAKKIVCAWGAHGKFKARDTHVLSGFGDVNLAALKITKDGAPGHPLYLAKTAQPLPYHHPDYL